MKRLITIASVAVLAVSALVLMQCDELLGGRPLNVTIVADTDSTVKITWGAPTEGTPDKYIVLFMETGTSGYTELGDATATEYAHDPEGKTGKYKVTAKFGSDEYDGAATPSTTPIANTGTTVGELNSADLAGYGWNRSTGDASTYTMEDAGSAANVDFYITDWAIGYTGPDYSIASPDYAPTDPGNVTPAGSWRVNAFSNLLTSEHDPLPKYVETINYFGFTDLTTDPALVACYTKADGYYALVKLSGYNTINGTVQAQSWFQLVKGLRLIQH